MAYTFNPFTGNFDVADVVTFSPPAVDLTPYELKDDSEQRDKDLQDQIDALDAAAFDEAPQDGTPYSRQDAGWVSITLFIDAPVDGKQYVRKDGVWEEVEIGSGDFEEPPADDLSYVRSTPSVQIDPAKPIGEWLKLSHTDPSKLWLRKSTDPQYGPDDGVKENDLQYVTDKDKLFIYRDVFEDGSAYFWTQCLYSNTGSGSGIPEAPDDGYGYVRQGKKWVRVTHTDPNKLWLRASTDPNFVPADGVRENDLQYTTDTDKLFIYRDVFGDGSAYFWTQCLYTNTGGGSGGISSVAVVSPLKDSGTATDPALLVDLNTLSSPS